MGGTVAVVSVCIHPSAVHCPVSSSYFLFRDPTPLPPILLFLLLIRPNSARNYSENVPRVLLAKRGIKDKNDNNE